MGMIKIYQDGLCQDPFRQILLKLKNKKMGHFRTCLDGFVAFQTA